MYEVIYYLIIAVGAYAIIETELNIKFKIVIGGIMLGLIYHLVDSDAWKFTGILAIVITLLSLFICTYPANEIYEFFKGKKIEEDEYGSLYEYQGTAFLVAVAVYAFLNYLILFKISPYLLSSLYSIIK